MPAFLRTLAKFEHHVKHACTRQAALGSLGSMPDSGERRFDGIRGAHALPVDCWKIIKGQQFILILEQALHCTRILVFVGFDK